MQNISTVGIISKPKIAQAREIVCGLLAWLDKRGVRYRCDQLTAEYAGNSEFVSREDLHEGIDLLIVLGGDGTLLSAAPRGGRIMTFPSSPSTWAIWASLHRFASKSCIPSLSEPYAVSIASAAAAWWIAS